MPPMPLIAVALPSCSLSAELDQPLEAWGLGAANDNLAPKLEPCVRCERFTVAGNAETQPAGNSPPSQHGLRCKRPRQAEGFHPLLVADGFHRPGHPAHLVLRKAIDATGGSTRPCEDPCRRQPAHRQPCRRQYHGSFAQIFSTPGFELHFRGPGSTMRTRRRSSRVCRNGPVSRPMLSISTSKMFDSTS